MSHPVNPDSFFRELVQFISGNLQLVTRPKRYVERPVTAGGVPGRRTCQRTHNEEANRHAD